MRIAVLAASLDSESATNPLDPVLSQSLRMLVAERASVVRLVRVASGETAAVNTSMCVSLFDTE